MTWCIVNHETNITSIVFSGIPQDFKYKFVSQMIVEASPLIILKSLYPFSPIAPIRWIFFPLLFGNLTLHLSPTLIYPGTFLWINWNSFHPCKLLAYLRNLSLRFFWQTLSCNFILRIICSWRFHSIFFYAIW